MTRHDGSVGRRAFLAGSAALGTAGTAGCLGLIGSEDDDGENVFGQIGSGRAGRPEPGGTPVEELPDLEGELTVYSGRSEFLVGSLVDDLEEYYDDFSIDPRYGDSSDLVNQIREEGSGTPADVFYTVDAAALGDLADNGRASTLSDDLLEMVRSEFRTDQWIGTSGRARAIPYNTDALSEDDMPDSIDAYATDFDGDLGWAPSYGSCQSFVTAMRLLEGEDATREWLEGVVDSGITDYNDEYAVCEAIANGEIDAGFTNHYYVQRVRDGSDDAPIATSFTEGDAGSIFDVAGAAVTDAADDPDLAENFVRHLLSSQAQEYFATSTFEYPLIPGVEPVGDLPTIDELDVPDLDLSRLSDRQPTIDLMREVGINT
ncbi:iron ABC transporter substrate-binding protein [Halosolutus halophilus]|uniref:iron ABC transporter substrate-binding protein n=1 Tax=Halosolutus halophilus TaxID=1552990 RepID=UPI0022351484|nr:iron ABC transporter substrate-binding protein [Halosolutus halophilus]